jgi:hypothetical protein
MADVWLAVLGSMQAFSETLELEERLRKQRCIKYIKIVIIYV